MQFFLSIRLNLRNCFYKHAISKHIPNDIVTEIISDLISLQDFWDKTPTQAYAERN